MKPQIYICYGMAKSGSTLAYRLASAVAEAAGAPQGPAGLGGGDGRYAAVIRPRELEALFAAERPRPVVVKTHGGLWRKTAEALAAGRATALATCRDPRDAVLSMLDAGARGDDWGRSDVEAALKTVRAQVEKFEAWARAPNALVLPYERTAADPAGAAARIAEQIGAKVDAEACAKAALSAGTLLNRGRAHRHAAEMDPALAARIRDEFGAFIARWDLGPKASPGPRLIGG
ncbi:MAG: sulfotransferase domain-containing protein [Pseudomonadota bacterium]